MDVTSAYTVSAIVACGMGVAFSVADWRSPTSRWLALFLVGIGVALEMNRVFATPALAAAAAPATLLLSGLPIALALFAGGQWLLGVRRTIPTAGLNTRFADRAIRLAQLAAIVYGVVSLRWWRERVHVVTERLGDPSAFGEPMFLLLGGPFFAAMALLAIGAVITLRRNPDGPERVRLLALIAALPALSLGFVLPMHLGIYGVVVGLMIFLVGSVEYHVVQGQRGQFMSRFLAPQVADLVRRQGLQQAIPDQSGEISVVHVDIRGFTAYAERAGTEQVLKVLRAYYDAVGACALEVGATIKDYAGDGVLILIGAPLPFADHAERALTLATALMQRAGAAVRDSCGDGTLGLGVGIATGRVAAGVVGGARLEYVAVGSTVNLAARLGQFAQAGEILVDARTRARLAEHSRLQPRAPAPLKGFAAPVPHYALQA